MESSRFDAITKTLGAAGSRRATLHTLAAGALAVGLGRLGRDDAAAKKKRKRKKKLKKNAYGCVNVGGKCRGNSANCCSGLCEGKKPKKGKKDKSKCIAHNELDCPAEADICSQVTITCGTFGLCYRTTGQASFCGRVGDCVACQKDTDCEADFGPGAACIVCPGCPQTGTLCVPPDVPCPDGTEPCFGECVAVCLAGVQTRPPFDCSCCQVNNAPPSPGCGQFGLCCSGICAPVGGGLSMCVGIAAGNACEFDAQCQSGDCNNGTCD